MIKELVEYIVKHLAHKPDRVSISVKKDGEKHHIEIMVDEQDRGKIIGREGQTIKAIRMIVGAVTPEEKKITVDLAK